MGYAFYIILFGIMVFVTMKNVKMIMRYKHNGKYVDCYKAMMSEEDHAIGKINEYIAGEKNEEFAVKGKILKIYALLSNGEYCLDDINELDIHSLAYKNGKVSKDMMFINSDSFVWIIMIMVKAKMLDKVGLLEAMHTKMMEYDDDLCGYVEFASVKNAYSALCDKDDKGIVFFNRLLNGEYTDYLYDKNLIGLFKRMASSFLTYLKEDLDEYFRNDLYSFAQTLVGRTFLMDLGLYETYKPKDTEVQ